MANWVDSKEREEAKSALKEFVHHWMARYPDDPKDFIATIGKVDAMFPGHKESMAFSLSQALILFREDPMFADECRFIKNVMKSS